MIKCFQPSSRKSSTYSWQECRLWSSTRLSHEVSPRTNRDKKLRSAMRLPSPQAPNGLFTIFEQQDKNRNGNSLEESVKPSRGSDLSSPVVHVSLDPQCLNLKSVVVQTKTPSVCGSVLSKHRSSVILWKDERRGRKNDNLKEKQEDECGELPEIMT